MSTLYINNFCRNLKLFRSRKGISQSEMAKSLGIGQSTYSHYEVNRVPPGDILANLALMGFDITQAFLRSDAENDSNSVQSDPLTQIRSIFNVILNDETRDPVVKHLLFDALKERFERWNDQRLAARQSSLKQP
jgi:transcriptional regulator with XRE-family HTH domain